MIILESTRLSKRYKLGDHLLDALVNIDLTVSQGVFLAIMGPSGSGKSTLLHLLGGLDQPTTGEIRIAGLQLSNLNDNEATLARRHNVGFIFQSFNLLPMLTAEENIQLPLIFDGQNSKETQERIDRLLDLVGLSDRRNHKPSQLSGGEQQRVAIARALVTQPAIILADEPTGNLDSKNSSAIMELLRRSRDELQQTIIMVTHDPRAATYADRVIFLRDGQIQSEVNFETQQEVEERFHIVVKMMGVFENN